MKQMFEDMVERLFTDTVTPELIIAAEREWPADLWQQIEEAGLPLAAVPEELGGVGASFHDAYGIVCASGRHAAPVPLAEAIAVNWLLGLHGVGPVPIGTIAFTDEPVSAGTFEGTLGDVPWGRTASHVLVAGPEGHALLLPTQTAEATPALNLAREPRDGLTFPKTEAVAVPGLSADAVRLCAAAIRAAQIAGALDRILETAIDYAGQRVQFGRPIGKFQVIQHQIVILAELAAMSGSAAEAAFATADEGGCNALHAASAKMVASEACGKGAAIAHAVLGAIGFTYEHALHLSTRRLWAWRSEYGGQTAWSDRLGKAACSAGADGYWPAMTAGNLASL